MFAWILILGCWVALLVLILHDATKEDSDGGAISIAAKHFSAFIFWAMLKAQKLRGTFRDRTSQASVSKPPVKVVTTVLKKWWRKDHRVSKTTLELELAISEAVKSAAPGCEDFVGVIVRHTAPKSHLDPNWEVRGVKFGKADRKMVDQALATVVDRMQQEFRLSDD
jgi:hypothetical protein